MKWNVLKDMQALYECGKIKRKPSFVDDPNVDHLHMINYIEKNLPYIVHS